MPVQVTPFRGGNALRDIALQERNQANLDRSFTEQRFNADRNFSLRERGVNAQEAANQQRATALSDEQKRKAMAAIPGAIKQAIETAGKAPDGRKAAVFNSIVGPYLQAAREHKLPVEKIEQGLAGITEEDFAVTENFDATLQRGLVNGEEQFFQVGDQGGVRPIDGVTPPEKRQSLGAIQQGQDAQGNPVFFQVDAQGVPQVVQGVSPKQSATQTKVEADRKDATTRLDLLNQQFVELIQDEEFPSAVGAVDQFTAKIGGALGTRQGVINRRATRLVNQMVAEATQQLKGALSEKELAFIRDTKPSTGDAPEVWRDWYSNEFLPLVNQARQSNGQPAAEDPFSEDVITTQSGATIRFN